MYFICACMHMYVATSSCNSILRNITTRAVFNSMYVHTYVLMYLHKFYVDVHNHACTKPILVSGIAYVYT